MSQDAIRNISTAIGQIYSGNVTGINENMQNLFAMAAARSGQSYADILTQGINGGDVNALLQSMVEYLAEIAGDTNNVVRTAHGNVFGIAVSDLKAASNLIPQLSAVSSTSTSLGTMLSQTSNMVGTISERLGMAGMIDRLLDNVTYSAAANVVGNSVGQALWQMIDRVSGIIDIAIPSVGVLGNFLSLNGSSTSDLIKFGLGGVGSLIGGTTAVINSIRNGGAGWNLSSDLWDTTGLASSGSGFANLSAGGGKSIKVATGGGDITSMEVADIKSDTLKQQGYDEGATAAPEKSVDDIWDNITKLDEDIIAILNQMREDMFGANRKPLLVDINNMPKKMTEGDGDSQALRVVVGNTDADRVPVELPISSAVDGIGSFMEQLLGLRS